MALPRDDRDGELWRRRGEGIDRSWSDPEDTRARRGEAFLGEGCLGFALSRLKVGRGGNLVNLSPIDDPPSPGNSGNLVNPHAESFSWSTRSRLSDLFDLIRNLSFEALGRNIRLSLSSPGSSIACFQAHESNWELVIDSTLDVESILRASGRFATCPCWATIMLCSA